MLLKFSKKIIYFCVLVILLSGCSSFNKVNDSSVSNTDSVVNSEEFIDLTEDELNRLDAPIKELVTIAKDQLYYEYVKRSKRSRKVAYNSNMLPKIAHDKNGNPKVRDYPRVPTGQCYLFVKAALLKAGIVSSKLYGVSAKHAGKELIRHGFTKLNITPEDAPIGAILVYKGYGRRAVRKHGHIEIKVSNNEFASDCLTTMPKTNKRKALIGIYYKNTTSDQLVSKN